MSYMDDFRHLEIQLEDIKAATNNFSDKPIGTGGFGDVYKGELLLPEGRRVVAFKRLNRNFGQGDVEFWKEITMLSELSHKNLASLLQFCREGDERILVYEYASHQSLDRYLDKASLTWTQRLDICLGAARGISYLHDPKKTQHRVLHRDIKSSNILLDDKWTAKVSDFGLSKITPANQPRTFVVSNVVGTPGYCDPRYHETGILSKECDVYSFGVVLFEVMCGRLCCEFDKDKVICILVHTWKSRYDEDRLDEIVFPDLMQQINQESMKTFAAIAKQCLNRDLKERPNMVEVVKELEIAHQQLNVIKTPMSYGFMEEFDHLRIQLEDAKLSTNNFSDETIIGRGAFGNLYKGELSQPGGQSMVCFKRLDNRLGQGNVEFWNEITILSKCKHENLVSLLNFCYEGNEKILVYNYASRGSLDRHLGEPGLTWIQRLKICVAVAHALNYLHDPPDTQNRVVHGDIKSTSILLDEDWTANVSDLGQSKMVPKNQPQTFFTFQVGTLGYCDPQYFKTGFLSKEADVYSFGVVLFELMCGRLCTDYNLGGLTWLVPKWIRYYGQKKLDEIIFSDLKEQMDSRSLNTFSSIAYRCLKIARKKRPTMAKVIKELEIALEQQEDFEETVRFKNLGIAPISDTPRNQMRFPNGILVGDGNTWLSVFKNGKVCEVISATRCIYGDSLVREKREKSRFGQVLFLPFGFSRVCVNSRTIQTGHNMEEQVRISRGRLLSGFSNIVKGRMYNGFTVKLVTQYLSPKATYTVSLVFKHNGSDHGTHIPFKFKVDEERNYSNSCMTHVRADGWLMIELYQFTSYKREHDLGIHFLPLFNIASSSIEYFLEGIEFFPVKYIS